MVLRKKYENALPMKTCDLNPYLPKKPISFEESIEQSNKQNIIVKNNG